MDNVVRKLHQILDRHSNTLQLYNSNEKIAEWFKAVVENFGELYEEELLDDSLDFLALYYMNRYLDYAESKQSVVDDQDFSLIVIVAYQIASKFLIDISFNNKQLAKMFQIPTHEITTLEREFVFEALSLDLYVDLETLREFENSDLAQAQTQHTDKPDVLNIGQISQNDLKRRYHADGQELGQLSPEDAMLEEIVASLDELDTMEALNEYYQTYIKPLEPSNMTTNSPQSELYRQAKQLCLKRAEQMITLEKDGFITIWKRQSDTNTAKQSYIAKLKEYKKMAVVGIERRSYNPFHKKRSNSCEHLLNGIIKELTPAKGVKRILKRR